MAPSHLFERSPRPCPQSSWFRAQRACSTARPNAAFITADGPFVIWVTFCSSVLFLWEVQSENRGSEQWKRNSRTSPARRVLGWRFRIHSWSKVTAEAQPAAALMGQQRKDLISKRQSHVMSYQYDSFKSDSLNVSVTQECVMLPSPQFTLL